MNVHPDCQIDAGKCTPKSRLLRRQKSASELDSRVLPGTEDDSKYFFYFIKVHNCSDGLGTENPVCGFWVHILKPVCGFFFFKLTKQVETKVLFPW